MILVLDVGNTHLHIGLFTRGRLRATWQLSTDPRRTVDEFSMQLDAILGDGVELRGAIISSVAPRVTSTLARAIAKTAHVDALVLNSRTKIGVENGYCIPEEVGMDRLANAAGAVFLREAPILILDFGTAITLDYVAAPSAPGGEPTYMGGAIMPGLDLAIEALARGTAKLPMVELTMPDRIIGRTTADSIRSGLIHGYLGAVRSLIEGAWDEMGSRCEVIATGGSALRLRDSMPFVHAVEPDLTLYGLRQIYGINHDCPLNRP